MKTGSQFVKEAEQESIKVIGEVNKDFIIGYLSASIALIENSGAYQKGYNEGYEEGFQTAQVAERGINKVMEKIDLDEPDAFFNAVKIICKDYNDKILKP